MGNNTLITFKNRIHSPRANFSRRLYSWETYFATAVSRKDCQNILKLGNNFVSIKILSSTFFFFFQWTRSIKDRANQCQSIHFISFYRGFWAKGRNKLTLVTKPKSQTVLRKGTDNYFRHSAWWVILEVNAIESLKTFQNSQLRWHLNRILGISEIIWPVKGDVVGGTECLPNKGLESRKGEGYCVRGPQDQSQVCRLTGSTQHSHTRRWNTRMILSQ